MSKLLAMLFYLANLLLKGLKPFTTVFRRLLTMLSSTPKVDIPDFRQYLQDADREISALLLLFAEQNVFINGLKAAADQSCASIEDLKKVVTEKDASIVGLQNTTNGQVTRIGELCLEVSRLDSRRKRAVNERIAAENTLRITNDKCQSRIASNDAKISANNSRMLKMAKRKTVLDRERDQEAKKLEEAAEQAERAYDTACNELKAKIKRAEKAEKTAENDAAKVRKRLQGIKSEHQKDTAALQGENNVLESRLSNIQHGHDQMFKGWNQASRQDRGKIARLESEKEAKEEEVERADQVIKNLNLEVARRASEKVEGEKVAGQKLRVLKKTTDKLRAEMLEKTETADSKTKDLEQQIKKRDGEIKLLKFDVGRYRDTFHDRLVSSMSCVSGQIEATQEETRVAQREAGAQKFVKVRAWERIEELQGLLEMQTQPESDNPDAQRPTSNVQIYEQELRKANDREEELQRTVKEEKAEVLKLRNELQKSTSSNKEELERCQRREANQPVGTKKDDQKLRLKIGRVVQLEKRKHRASGRKERRRLSRKLKSSAAVQVKNLESMLQNLSTGTQIQVTGCQQQIEATRSRAETAESSNTALTDELARVRKAKDDAETRAEQLSQQVKDAAGQVETLQKDAGDTETRYEAILNDMKEKMAGVERDANRANDLFSELSGWPTDDAEYGCLAELYHGHAAVRDLKAKLQDDESDLSKHWNTEATIGSITSQLDGASVQRGTTRKVDADLAPAMLFQCRALNAKAESLKRLLEQGPLMSKEEFLAELDGARGDEGVLGRDFVRTQEEEQDSEGDAEMEGESDAQTQPAAAYPPSPFSTPSTSQPLQTRPPTSQASSSQAPLGYLPAYLQNASPSHTLVEGSSTPNPFLAFRPGAPRPTFSQHQSQSQPFSGSRLPLRSPPYTPPSGKISLDVVCLNED